MKDVKAQIQTSYFSLLNTKVILAKELWPAPIRPTTDYTVPVYDNVPSTATYPYIKLGEWTEVDDSDKSSFGSELTFTVQVVDRYENSITRAPLYEACNQLKQIIRSRPIAVTATGFNVINSIIDNENTFRELTDTHIYLYNNIRFRHIIEQK